MTPIDLPVVWSVAFDLPHAPRPKARHRARVVIPNGKKPFVHEYPDPDGERDERTMAALAAAHAPPAPAAGPVVLHYLARVPVPASWPAWEREAALAGAPWSRGCAEDASVRAAVIAISKLEVPSG